MSRSAQTAHRSRVTTLTTSSCVRVRVSRVLGSGNDKKFLGTGPRDKALGTGARDKGGDKR
jgi:hypothetical protein